MCRGTNGKLCINQYERRDFESVAMGFMEMTVVIIIHAALSVLRTMYIAAIKSDAFSFARGENIAMKIPIQDVKHIVQVLESCSC